MVRSLFVWAALAAASLAAPTSSSDWTSLGPKGKTCTPETRQVRKDFDKLEPKERKAFTDAINCLREQPSQLDQTKYPGAINRFFDYAAVHIERTNVVHLDGFFLTWHRTFLHLFEQDLKETCGFKGALPYWNWPATADSLETAPIWNGDEYSMSGNGEYINAGPYALGPNFTLPHGSGGGCITSGPFKGMEYTFQPISNQVLLNGSPLPPNAFALNKTCLTRDLNTKVAQTYLNQTAYNLAIQAPSQSEFSSALNGIFGGGALGLHSGAHFSLGPPVSNIFVSPQDPAWYPMHVALDLLYVQWQEAHPEIYDQVYGTETANNQPPSANVTLDSVTPDFGYFGQGQPIRNLISTTAGPFCYEYDA